MEPIKLEVTLDLDAMAKRLWVGEDDVPPATLEEVVIRGAIEVLASRVYRDMKQELHRRVSALRDEEIRTQLAPLIAEAITRASQTTDSFGEPKGPAKTLSELIIASSTAQLRHDVNADRGYGQKTKTLLDTVIGDEVAKVVGKELREAMSAAKEQVKAAVEAEGASSSVRRSDAWGRVCD